MKSKTPEGVIAKLQYGRLLFRLHNSGKLIRSDLSTRHNPSQLRKAIETGRPAPSGFFERHESPLQQFHVEDFATGKPASFPYMEVFSGDSGGLDSTGGLGYERWLTKQGALARDHPILSHLAELATLLEVESVDSAVPEMTIRKISLVARLGSGHALLGYAPNRLAVAPDDGALTDFDDYVYVSPDIHETDFFFPLAESAANAVHAAQSSRIEAECHPRIRTYNSHRVVRDIEKK